MGGITSSVSVTCQKCAEWSCQDVVLLAGDVGHSWACLYHDVGKDLDSLPSRILRARRTTPVHVPVGAGGDPR